MSYNKQYLINLIPFIGFIIIAFLIMLKYYKHFNVIEGGFYFLTGFIYLGLIVIISDLLLNYPDEELFHGIAFYIELLLVGFLMIATQKYIFKKHGIE